LFGGFAISTQELRILSHSPVPLTFIKLKQYATKIERFQGLKTRKKRRLQENDKIAKKSTQDLAGASLVFFLLPVVPHASSPVTHV